MSTSASNGLQVSDPSEEKQRGRPRDQGADAEACDLRDLHLSATFLTPYAVAPSQDKHVWLSNAQEAFTDHTKRKNRAEMTPVVKKTSNMSSMIGFQGQVSGRLQTETRDTFVFDKNFQDFVEDRDRTYFRKRDHFSDYAEAKARDPSRANR